MRRKNRKKYYYIMLFIALFGMSFGYATLNTTLIINGTSAIQKNTWDIHFENLKINKGSVTATTEPTITESNKISNFTFVLDKRGDFYEFTIDIINNGTLDAMIDSIEKTPALTSEQEKYLIYTITYENDEEIKKNHLIKINEFVRIKVRVEFKNDITASDLPQTQQVLNLGLHINYIQDDGNGVDVKDNGIADKSPIANGQIDEIGTIVTIGTEKFYTIGTEGDNVKLLSMYNLYVGGKYDNEWISYGDEATRMQDANMKGYQANETIANGVTMFSDDSQKGTNYSDYSGSIVEEYVNNYKYLLETNYETQIVEARLITYSELTDVNTFACKDNSTCSNSYPWIYSSSYWTGTANSTDNIWTIYSQGTLYSRSYSYNYPFGVRPVIVIPKNTIKVDSKPIANGSLDEIGTIVTIGSEKFYTIGTEGNNVKLLSMYNLYVGNIATSTNKTTPIENPTGMQSESSKGYLWDYELETEKYPFNGTTEFSNDTQKGENYSSYNGSLVEKYVNEYKNILKSKFGLDVVEARLLELAEITDQNTFACVAKDYCSEKYPWIYSTSYWFETAYNTINVWYVFSDGYINNSSYSFNYRFGVRPVIVVTKDTIEIKS